MKHFILPAIAVMVTVSACSSETAPPEPSLPSARQTPAIVFIRNSVRSDISRHALLEGELVTDKDGCLRIGGQNGPFIIWYHDTTLSFPGADQVLITDGYTGRTVRVGEQVAVAGSGEARVPPASGHQEELPGQVTDPIPDACASGEIWWAGPVLSEEDRERLTHP